jgi:hypothetical protein
VIFDSNLFQKADAIAFKRGCLNRRIYFRLLRGDR